MKNIHLLPTDKPSRLHEYDYSSPMGLSKEPLQWRLGRNIYITSDEDIKEGDWYVNTLDEVVRKNNTINHSYHKKIILTTDQELIKDGVQAIDDDFIEWFVKNPSCEEVEISSSWHMFSNKDAIKNYGIIIPSSEIWKDIPDYNGLYQVSNLGNIRSLNYGKIRELKPRLVGYDGNQYLAVNLSKDSEVKSIKVHKLVALCFLNHISKGYNGLVIDHIDSNKLNNRLDNLKLVTPRFNASKDKQGSSSKFTGVTWHKKSKKWQCQIYDNGKLNHLGLFNTEIEASETYNNYLENMTKEEPKHKGKELTKEEVMKERSSAYEFLDFDKQETLEEAIIRLTSDEDDVSKRLSGAYYITKGVKWQQERSYSEEEVKNLTELFLSYYFQSDKNFNNSFDEWFEQFKNK